MRFYSGESDKIYGLPLLLLVLLMGCGGQSSDSSRVQKGAFKATLTETGELHAVNSYLITVPYYSWRFGKAKIIHLEKEGIHVKRGDVVAKLDTSIFIRDLGEKRQELAIAEADYKKLLVQQATGRKEMESAIQSNRASLESVIIDTQRVQFEPVNKQKIARYKYAIADKRYVLSQQKYELLLNIQEEERMIQEGKIAELKADMQKAESYMKRFTIKAPANGMIEYKQMRRSRQKVKIGDEFWPGDDFLGLPDLSRIKVRTQINEADIYKVKKGQSVKITLDAFPQKIFTGSITQIGVICREKDDDSHVKVFDAEILINETDITLKPGMTVSCEILIADLKDVMFVEHMYIQQEKNNYFVFKKRGGRTIQVPVELGEKNARWIVVDGELKKGDHLVLPHEIGDNT